MKLDIASTLGGAALPPEQVRSPLDRPDTPSKFEVHDSDAGRKRPRGDHADARHVLLKYSPYAEGEGELIGRDPREIPLADWRTVGVELLGVMQAIRDKCLDCSGYQPGEVRKCVAVTCPLWPFRMRVDVFHGKRAPSSKTGG